MPQQNPSTTGSSIFPDDLRSTSAPPQQLLSRRGNDMLDGHHMDPEQLKYYHQQQQQQENSHHPSWQLWQNADDGKFYFFFHFSIYAKYDYFIRLYATT